jgi:site-specific DNA recombinase
MIFLPVLGAVAELERAKITERMTRGKLHRLRQGVMASGGVAPFGYRYTNAPRALVPQEPEAEVVRWMFETYAAGATLRSLAKSLEHRGVRTRFGKELWAYAQIRDMMNNPAYAGMRYFNRRTEVKDDPQRKRGRTILRDRSEWIGIAVPPLVSTELFDRVQERLAGNLQRYLQPAAHYALSGLVECGECGSAFCSYRRYVAKELVTGVKRVSHKAAYKCNWRVRQLEHDAKLVERCRNPEVATHLLEGKVFEMIRETMFDPSKLRACVQAPVKRDGERGIARRLGRIARHLVAIEEDRKRLIELYACERLESREYIEANRELDAKLARLKREKREIAAGVPPLDAETALETSLRTFCEDAKATFDASADPDARRAFLAGRIDAYHLSQAPGDHRRRGAAATD